MRKVLIVLVLVLAAVTTLVGPAGAIVHGFTPVECAQSGNAGGVQAADDNPQFEGMPILRAPPMARRRERPTPHQPTASAWLRATPRVFPGASSTSP